MIRLSTTSQKLQAVLAGAVTTNQLHCVVCYSDDNGSTYVGGTQLTSTNDTTAVDICAAPAASTVRDIDNLSIRNRDTAAATVTVMLDSSGADSEIVKATLAIGDSLLYTHGDGWKVVAVDGAIKTGAGLAYTPVNKAGDSMTGLLRLIKGPDIASAATVDLGTATGNTVDVTHSTGTTAITSLGGASLQAGTEIETRFVISGGTLTLTHHATNLYLAGGANITLANGDVIRWRKMHSSNAEWKMVGGKLPASQAEAEAGTDNGRDMTPLRVAQAIAALGSSVALDSPITMATGSPAIIEISTSIPAGTKRIDIGVAGGSTNSTSKWLIQIGDSGGFETTGYSSGATNDNGTRVTSTAGFIVTSAEAAALSWSGVITLLLIDAANNTWVESGHLTDVGSGANSESGGHKSLSGELTSIRWTTVGGTAVADAGTLAIQYS